MPNVESDIVSLTIEVGFSVGFKVGDEVGFFDGVCASVTSMNWIRNKEWFAGERW
jgi:hypothetical protein